MAGNYNIKHNERLRHFEYAGNGETAFVEYRFQNKSIALLHTVVPEKLGGKGVAAALADYAFAFAKEHHMPVIVYCEYIQGYLKKHPELTEQLDKEFKN